MRGYRRAEKNFNENEVNEEEFGKSHPLFSKIKSILSQDPADEDSVSAKGEFRLNRLFDFIRSENSIWLRSHSRNNLVLVHLNSK